jgi:membrane protease YdiL (CAAX protease family)
MSFAISSINPSCTTSAITARVSSLRASARDACDETIQKIQDAVTSPIGQGVVGFGLGVGAHKVYGSLTQKIVKGFGVSTVFRDPFSSLSLGYKILITPFVCITGPILEEKLFRGDLQGMLKGKFESFYVNQGFSESAAHTAARVTSVFFASVVFGLVHFTNAILFWCNPLLFLPQVVAATIMGLIFGLAKEFTGGLHMPIGMHIGNNTFTWAHYIKNSI